MMQIGQQLNFPWPHIDGFYNTKATDKIIESLKKNDFYHISEKFDGSNVCVSSQGWISGRKTVFALEDTLKKTKFQAVDCKYVVPVIDKLKQFKAHLLKTFDLEEKKNDDIFLYGEFMLNGTSNSKIDRYEYKDGGIYPGDYFVFGIGFYFSDLNNDSVNIDLKEKITNQFNNLSEQKTLDEKNKFYISMVNFENKFLFKEFDLQTVRCFQGTTLSNLLLEKDYFLFGDYDKKSTSEYFIEAIEKRKVEGWILHNRDATDVIKWKYVTEKNSFIDQHMNKLINGIANGNINIYPLTIQHQMLGYLTNHYNNCDKFINVLDKTFYKNIFLSQNKNQIKKSCEFYINQFKHDAKHLDSNVEFMVKEETLSLYRKFKFMYICSKPGTKFLDKALKIEIKNKIFSDVYKLAVEVLSLN